MMSECLQEDRVIICSENVSDDYRITTDEILSHAKRLGVDYENERHLLPFVVRGLIHPLPSNWIPCYDKQQEEFFYYNIESAKSQWQHPIDEYYKILIRKIRNKSDVNSIEYLHSEEYLNMLPLRQNKKPQLLPIKQLLKYKDEDKISADGGKIFKSDLPSSLKTRHDSSSNRKKTVSFSSKSFSEKESQFVNHENGTNIDKGDKILKQKSVWNSEFFNLDQAIDDFRSLYDRSSSHSDDDDSPEQFRDDSDSNKKRSLTAEVPSSVARKQSSNQNKSLNNETHPKNHFKRLQINLRHPDSFLLSDNNHDDSIKNILSGSASSEICSEDDTPHNILTNITESGIDVNTVTDLQKLKAKNKMNSQSHSYDSNKREVSNVDATLNEVIANLEQGLNTRFDMKITEEMEKLKKFYQKNMEIHFNESISALENQKTYQDEINEAQEKFQSFKQEIIRKIDKVDETFNEFKLVCNLEIKNLKESLQSVNIEYECSKNLETLHRQINNSFEERLNSVEQNLTKKLDSVETKRKKEVEKFNVEKEKVLSEHHEKFQSFMDEYRKNFEKICQENSRVIIQRELKELLMNEIKIDDPMFKSMEKIVTAILHEKLKNESIKVGRKTIATQTENTQDMEETVIMKEKLDQISTTVQHLAKEIHVCKRNEQNEASFIAPKQHLRELILQKNKKAAHNLIQSRPFTPLRAESYKTDFTPFEEYSSDIDKELECYRKKYLSDTKWSPSK